MSIHSDQKCFTNLKKSVMTVIALFTIMLVLPLAAIPVEAQQADDTANGEILPDPNEYVPVDQMPELIHSEAPTYPRLAEKAGVQGAVWVKACVNKEGRVVKAITYKSSGFKTLDDAALEVAPKNRYKPATLGGDPVTVWISYKVNFEIDFNAGTSGDSEG